MKAQISIKMVWKKH